MPKTGRPEESGGDAFEAGCSKFGGLGRAVGEIRGGEFHFGKSFGHFRVGLVGSSDFARQVAGGGAAHSKWEYRFAGDAVQQERIAVFGGCGYDIDALAFAGNGGEVWRGGNIAVPKVVGNFLKMPETPAGAGVECNQAIREEIVAQVGDADEVRFGSAGGDVSNTTHLIHR